jgi:hypothetical protein
MQCPNCHKVWPDDFKVCPICAVTLVTLTAEMAEGASGVLAQGAGAEAAGGVVVGGDLVGGDKVGGDKITAGDVGPGAAAAVGAGSMAVGGDVHGNVYIGVPPQVPSGPSRPKVYHNLPHPDYGTFVGREKELDQIHQLLLPYPRSRYHVITIDGIGGIGKSALALEVAHRYTRDVDVLPADERFEAVVWTSAKQTVLTAAGIIERRVELRRLDDIYAAIAVALERSDITQARPEERPAVVARALARQRTLLIVDNLETTSK